MLSRSPKMEKGIAKMLADVEEAVEESLPLPEVVVTKRRRSRAGSFTSADHVGLGLAHLQAKADDDEEHKDKDMPWRSPRKVSGGDHSPSTLKQRITEALSPNAPRRHSAPRVMPQSRLTRPASPVGSPISSPHSPHSPLLSSRSHSMPGVVAAGRKFSTQADAHSQQLAALLARFRDSPPIEDDFDDELMSCSPTNDSVFNMTDEEEEETSLRSEGKDFSSEAEVFLDEVTGDREQEVFYIDGTSPDPSSGSSGSDDGTSTKEQERREGESQPAARVDKSGTQSSPFDEEQTSTDDDPSFDDVKDQGTDEEDDQRSEALRKLSEESEDSSEFESADESSDIDNYIAAVDAGAVDFNAIELPNQNVDDFSFVLLLDKLSKAGKLDQITRINMDGNELEEASAYKLGELLSSSTALQYLDLRWNLVGIEGLQAICAALETNTTLTSLNLDGNELGFEGARILSFSLAKNRGIQHLELRDNTFGDAGVEALCHGIRGHSTLQLLDLGSNEITAVGASVLARFLLADYEQVSEDGVSQTPSALRVLILNGNEAIGDEGCTAIAKSLIINSTLSSLQLRKCGIHAEGAVGIADVLLNDNSSLLELDFNDNMPGVEGELALNDLLMQSEDLYVEWKDPTEQSKWDFEQVQFIIDHYGQSEIIANILREYTLEPLIENQKVLGVLEITDIHVANLFLTELLTSEAFMKTGLRMLITILRKGLSAHEADDFDELSGEDLFLSENSESIEEMAPLPRCLSRFLPKIISLLDQEPEPQEMSWGETVVPLGDIRLQTIMFINALMDEEGSEVLNCQIMDAGVPRRFMELFVEHKHSTILHGAVQAFVRVCMRTDSVRFRLLDEFHLLEWIADNAEQQWALDVSERASYSGFLYAITEDLLKFSFDAGVAKRFRRNHRWRAFLEAVDDYRQHFVWETI